MACGAVAGGAGAVESAFQNRNSPARELRRRGRLRAPINRPIVQLIAQKETSAQNASTGQSEQDGQNEVTDPIDLTDPIATTEAIEPSVPSTARRRDTSPSSCRESPSPSISVWRRPIPRDGRKDLPSQG